MKIRRILLFVFLLPLLSCSFSQIVGESEEENREVTENETENSVDEKNDETPDENLELVSEEEKALPGTGVVNDIPSNIEAEDLLSAQDSSLPDLATTKIDIESSPTKSDNLSGVEGKYIVEENDTLMMVAFKLYGDYSKWKELANFNGMQKPIELRRGMSLKYLPASTTFVWNPKGSPYLIKTGDSLGSISHNVYGTNKKWKFLWENNRVMIKNPNLIFAGFTLYYLPLGNEMAVK